MAADERRTTASMQRPSWKVTTPRSKNDRALRGGQRRRARVRENGEAGIRTRDRGLTPYNGLANRRLQPLGHLSRRLAIVAETVGTGGGKRKPARVVKERADALAVVRSDPPTRRPDRRG